MNRTLSLIFTMGFFSFLFGTQSPAETPAPKTDGKDAGRALRQMMLTTPAAKYGIRPTPDFPRVYGILMDLPISGGNTATVVSTSSGTASLYTTSTFGIIGGEGHATVRAAAVKFTRAADAFFEAAKPATEFPYPTDGHVRFYLLTYEGVRCIETEMASFDDPKSTYTGLFMLGQEVLTELRLITQKKQ